MGTFDPLDLSCEYSCESRNATGYPVYWRVKWGSRGFVTGQFEQLHFYLATRVDGEDTSTRNVNTSIGKGVGDAVAKARIETVPMGRSEKPLNVSQAGHFEHFWLPHDDFSMDYS